MLGRLQLEGRGLPADARAALRLLRSAAEAGVAEAAFYLGLFYRSGDAEAGVPQDTAEAGRWLERAAEAGWGPAMLDLGQWKVQLRQDAAGRAWFERAWEAGEQAAARELGVFHAHPDPVCSTCECLHQRKQLRTHQLLG